MAWPASTQTLSDNLEKANNEMIKTKTILNSISVQSVSSDVPVQRIVTVLSQLAILDATLTATAAYGQDMIDYARTEFREPLMDVAAEFSAVKTAGLSLSTWISGAMADDTAITKTLNGESVANTYTSAQLTVFRNRVATFSATIT